MPNTSATETLGSSGYAYPLPPGKSARHYPALAKRRIHALPCSGLSTALTASLSQMKVSSDRRPKEGHQAGFGEEPPLK